MIEFKSLGHEARAHGWKVIVKGGRAELWSDDNNAYFSDDDPWCTDYSASELRDLAALFTSAADLLEGGAQ